MITPIFYNKNQIRFNANLKSPRLKYNTEDFFIKIEGFGKNQAWADKIITASDNAAERAVNLIPEMFDKVTNFVERSKKAPVEAEPEVETIVETE